MKTGKPGMTKKKTGDYMKIKVEDQSNIFKLIRIRSDWSGNFKNIWLDITPYKAERFTHKAEIKIPF